MADADIVWLEFVMDGLCGFCGNNGRVETTMRSPAGIAYNMTAFCICPNGRSLKTAFGRSKWDGHSAEVGGSIITGAE